LDDVEGTGFNLILAMGARVSPESTAFIEGRGGKVVTIADKVGPPGAIVDTHSKLTSFLKRAGVDAILVRPDFYVYGSASGPGDADRLVQALRADLTALGLKEEAPEPVLTKT
jgi:flavoprotein hydroxylase